MKLLRRVTISAAIAIAASSATSAAAVAVTSAAAPNGLRQAVHTTAKVARSSAASSSTAQSVNHFLLYYNTEPPGGHLSYACHGGATHVVPALIAMDELAGRNNCSVRVWLHQNPDGSGRALCIRPHSVAKIQRVYRQVQITNNTKSC
jgi:hypothetical protein